MERYYLFRGDELIYTADENATGALGAGDSHARGQTGDVLICAHRGTLRGWYWNLPQSTKPRDELPWQDIPAKDLDPKYRVLLLLQT